MWERAETGVCLERCGWELHGKAFVDLTFNDGTQAELPAVCLVDCKVAHRGACN